LKQLITDRLTNSQGSTLSTCMRKGYLAYAEGLRPVREGRKSLDVGNAMHKGWETLGETHDDCKAVEAALAEFDKTKPDTADPTALHDWRCTREIVWAMFQGYLWRWSTEDKDLEIVATELTFETPIINPATGRAIRSLTSAGKIDKIVRMPDMPGVGILEHKQTTLPIGPTDPYRKRLRIDSQVNKYFIAAEDMGLDAQYICYDVVRRPTLIPAILTQSNTAAFTESGEYIVGKDDEAVNCGMFRVEWTGNGKPIINGEEAEVIPGKKAFAIRETTQMFGARVFMTLTTEYEKYFARFFVPRTEKALDEFKQNHYQLAKLIHAANKSGWWPKNDKQCVSFGICPYYDVCAGDKPIEDGQTPEGFIRVHNPHVELQEDDS